ncbi:MAG: PH domain-containing protein [Solirubrobacterales bacterium]
MAEVKPQRLHPAALVLAAGRSLRELLVPLVLGGGIAATGPGSGIGVIGVTALGLVAAAGLGFASWRATTWEVSEGEVRLRSGIVQRSLIEVPLERVEALDTTRGPIQRLFGVVGVRIQAAGGGKAPEIVLGALSDEALTALRTAIERSGAGAATPADNAPAFPARALGARGMVVAALTAGQLGAIVPLLVAASQLADDVLGPKAGETVEGLLPTGAAEAVLAAGGLLGVAWILSIAGSVIAFARFRVTREPQRLRITRGLLSRHESSVPVGRVLAVRIVEGILRQPFGLASVRVETAGYGAEAAIRTTLFPLLPRDQIPALLDELLPELAPTTLELEGLPARARRRYLVVPIAAGLTVAAVAALIDPAAGAVAIAVPLVLGLWGWFRFRAAGSELREGRLALRFRRLARTTMVVRPGCVDLRTLSVNPLQRRAALASFEIGLASKGTARVSHLDAGTARSLAARLATAP